MHPMDMYWFANIIKDLGDVIDEDIKESWTKVVSLSDALSEHKVRLCIN